MSEKTSPTPASRPKAKTKTAKRGVMTDEMWVQLRAFYESGDYTQRHLVDFAKARGVAVSQSAISKRAVEEGWVKGRLKEELRQEIVDEIHGSLGETVKKMLEGHAAIGAGLVQEISMHIVKASRMRKTDPDYAIPALPLVQLVAAAEKATIIHARAVGFDYRAGSTFKTQNHNDEDDDGLVDLQVQVMSPAQEESVRRQAEEGDVLAEDE